MSKRIYLIGHKASGTSRLVVAGSQAQGLGHVARNEYTVCVATPMQVAELVKAGVEVEDASAEPAEPTLNPATPNPTPAADPQPETQGATHAQAD